MSRRSAIDVYAFRDHRALLRAYYEAKKAEGKGFSYRAFSRRIGVSSPNHLKRVIEGERNLPPETASKYAAAMGLEDEAAQYFLDLVAFGQAKTATERSHHYERLRGARGYKRAQKLDLQHAAYHKHWYIPAIREMAGGEDFRAEPRWVASRLLPPITVREATAALRTLTSLGLLAERDGRLVQADAVLTTGAETRGVHIANYHRAMLERASASIDLVPAAERDLSAVTFTVPADHVSALKERISAFRRELLAEFDQTGPGARVLQLNLQLFPLTIASEETP